MAQLEQDVEIPGLPTGIVLKGEYRFRTSEEDVRVRGEFQSCVESLNAGDVAILLEEIGKFPALEENENTPEFITEVEKMAKLLGIQVILEDRAGASDANHFSFGKEGIVVLDGFGPQGKGEHTDKERVDLRSIGPSVELARNIIKRKLSDS